MNPPALRVLWALTLRGELRNIDGERKDLDPARRPHFLGLRHQFQRRGLTDLADAEKDRSSMKPAEKDKRRALFFWKLLIHKSLGDELVRENIMKESQYYHIASLCRF